MIGQWAPPPVGVRGVIRGGAARARGFRILATQHRPLLGGVGSGAGLGKGLWAYSVGAD